MVYVFTYNWLEGNLFLVIILLFYLAIASVSVSSRKAQAASMRVECTAAVTHSQYEKLDLRDRLLERNITYSIM